MYGWVYISYDSSTKAALTNMNFIWVHFGNPDYLFFNYGSLGQILPLGVPDREEKDTRCLYKITLENIFLKIFQKSFNVNTFIYSCIFIHKQHKQTTSMFGKECFSCFTSSNVRKPL